MTSLEDVAFGTAVCAVAPNNRLWAWSVRRGRRLAHPALHVSQATRPSGV